MVNKRRGGYKSYIMLRLKVYLVNLLEASNLGSEFCYKRIYISKHFSAFSYLYLCVYVCMCMNAFVKFDMLSLIQKE